MAGCYPKRIQAEPASPRVGPIPLLLFVPLFAWLSFAPMYRNLSLWTALAVLCIIALALDRRVGRALCTRRDWPLGLVVLAFSANVVGARDPALARAATWEWVLPLTGLYFIGKGLMMRAHYRRPTLYVICGMAAAVAALGVYEIVAGQNPLYEHLQHSPYYERYLGSHRPVSFHYTIAPLATYLLLALPCCACLLRLDGDRGRVCGGIAIALILFCLLLAAQRSALLGLIAMSLFYLLVRRRWRWLLAVAALTVVLLGLYSVAPYPLHRAGFRGLAFGRGGMFSTYRVERILMAWDMVTDQPATGVGLKHYRALFDQYYPRPAQLHRVTYEHKIADNMWPTLLAETGFLGLGAFLVFIGILFARGLRKYRVEGDTGRQERILLILAGILGLMFSMGGYELFYWQGPYMFFALLCGFAGTDS